MQGISVLMSDLLQQLQKNPFVLAPMAGITDKPFRSFMKTMGCSVVITELVSATGLKFNSEKTKRIMGFEKIQEPVGIQIFGDSLEDLAFATKEVEQAGANFVDLNFGCPVNKVVKKGGGAAILKDLNRVRDVFRTTKSATNLPVTVKIRTGWDSDTRNSVELAQVAYDEGIEWVAIHGRTRAQAYKGEADWDYIKYVKQNAKLPILGNGDLTSAEKSVSRLKESGCDGVMIGRGCLKNPWIFKESMELLNKGGLVEADKSFILIFKKLTEFLEAHCEERIQTLQLKKLSCWFASGYPNSAAYRREVFQIKEKAPLIDLIHSYFTKLDSLEQADTSAEAFLMGGHG